MTPTWQKSWWLSSETSRRQQLSDWVSCFSWGGDIGVVGVPKLSPTCNQGRIQPLPVPRAPTQSQVSAPKSLFPGADHVHSGPY